MEHLGAQRCQLLFPGGPLVFDDVFKRFRKIWNNEFVLFVSLCPLVCFPHRITLLSPEEFMCSSVLEGFGNICRENSTLPKIGQNAMEITRARMCVLPLCLLTYPCCR